MGGRAIGVAVRRLKSRTLRDGHPHSAASAQSGAEIAISTVTQADSQLIRIAVINDLSVHLCLATPAQSFDQASFGR